MKTETKWYPLLLVGFVLLLASSLIACEPSTHPPPPSSSSHPTIAASPSSFSFITEQGVSNPSSQTLEIQNSGDGTLDWSATDDADWLSLSPTSGSCSSGEINNLAVSADASAISAGDYTTTITISAPEATNTPQTVAVNLTISPITPTVTYDVSVTVSPESQTGLPGDTLDYYTVTVTNTGTEADTYDLSISDDYEWTLICPSATSAIASGESENITISLSIPEDAVPETEDEITIIATSQNDQTASDSTTCTAVVIEEEPPPTPTSVSIIPSSKTLSPGDTFTIEVVIDSATNNVKLCEVEVSYDSTVFTAGTITEAGLLGTAAETLRLGPTIDNGEVSYTVTRLSGNPAVPVSGTFISITFEVSQTASPDSYYSLTIETMVVGADGLAIPGVVENDGLVIVQ